MSTYILILIRSYFYLELTVLVFIAVFFFLLYPSSVLGCFMFPRRRHCIIETVKHVSLTKTFYCRDCWLCLIFSFVVIHWWVRFFLHSLVLYILKATERTQVHISPTITGTVLLQTLLRPLLWSLAMAERRCTMDRPQTWRVPSVAATPLCQAWPSPVAARVRRSAESAAPSVWQHHVTRTTGCARAAPTGKTKTRRGTHGLLTSPFSSTVSTWNN